MITQIGATCSPSLATVEAHWPECGGSRRCFARILANAATLLYYDEPDARLLDGKVLS